MLVIWEWAWQLLSAGLPHRQLAAVASASGPTQSWRRLPITPAAASPRLVYIWYNKQSRMRRVGGSRQHRCQVSHRPPLALYRAAPPPLPLPRPSDLKQLIWETRVWIKYWSCKGIDRFICFRRWIIFCVIWWLSGENKARIVLSRLSSPVTDAEFTSGKLPRRTFLGQRRLARQIKIGS